MPKTVNDRLQDSQLRHEISLAGYARGTFRRQKNLLDRAINDLTFQLSKIEGKTFTRKRLERILKNITETNVVLTKGLSSNLDEDLRLLADHEASFQIAATQNAYPFELALTTVTPAQIHTAAMARPFQGKTLRDWFRKQSRDIQDAYQSAVRLGFVEGESIPQIVRRLKDVDKRGRNDIEKIIRTAITHEAQVARNKITEANSDLFSSEEWVATLDGRTCPICGARDGKRWPIGEGPFPPAHINCRCQRIPVTKSWRQLGFDGLDEDQPLSTRPFVADNRPVSKIPQNQRDQVIGTTTSKTYQEWLSGQSAAFQDQTLGKTKGKLFRNGDLPLDRFVDRRSNILTLDQLRERDMSAFERAGVA
jgi:SPP1 gp7 family putative phage head morphogenesis protein